MKTEWEYVLQCRPMRESFGHYSPEGDWEDVAVYKGWKTAMKNLSKTSHAANHPTVTHIFRVLTRKVEKGA